MSKSILFYKAQGLIGTSGGIEKVLTWQANEFAQRGYKVYIATRDKNKEDLFFSIEDNVVLKKINSDFSKIRRIMGKLSFNLIPYFNRDLYYSKKIKEFCEEVKPDVIIAAGIKDLAELTCVNEYNCKKILQIHSSPYYFINNYSQKLLSQISKADIVQVLMPSYKEAFKEYARGKIVTIGNPVLENNIVLPKEKVIVYVARIEKGKQQHFLIEAFAKIANKYPDWQVHFYGMIGNKKYFEECKNIINTKNIAKQVEFKGATKEIDKILASASVCAFPSAFEGFSLSLPEALAAGLPIIGFNNASFVNEIIENGTNGYLVANVDELAEKLECLIKDGELREKLGEKARNICEKYSPTKIIDAWESVINS